MQKLSQIRLLKITGALKALILNLQISKTTTIKRLVWRWSILSNKKQDFRKSICFLISLEYLLIEILYYDFYIIILY